MRGQLFLASLLLLSSLAGCLDRGGPSVPASSPGTRQVGRNQTLTVDFSFSPTNPTAGEPVQFADHSHDPESQVRERSWDFGDGHGSTDPRPLHAYEVAGLYRVTLRVQTESGLNATASDAIPVRFSDSNGTPPVPGVGIYLKFGAPSTVQASGGGEPSLAIDADGRLYVNPIGSLYRSEDEGKNWTRVDYPGLLSGDSHVTVDADKRVWASDLGGLTPPLLGSTTVWTSTDYGASWTRGNPAASDTVLNDRQWLAASSGGKGYLLYRSCTVFVPPGSCVSVGSLLTRSLDAGLTWAPVGQTFAWTSYPFVDSRDGTLYVVQANGNTIDVAVSRDDGVSFTQTTVANRASSPETLFLNGAVDDAGNAYVTWVDRDTGRYDVWMASSTDHGAHWARPTRVSVGNGTAIFPWLTAGGDGKVVLVWYGTTWAGAPGSAPASTEWSVYAAYTAKSHDKEPAFVQSRATGVIHKGPVCLSGAACTGNRELLDFFMVDLMPDGRAAIAYADTTTGGAKAQFILQVGGPLSR